MRKSDILDVLDERFGTVPEQVRARIQAVTDEESLRTILRRAVRSESLGEFIATMSPASGES